MGAVFLSSLFVALCMLMWVTGYAFSFLMLNAKPDWVQAWHSPTSIHEMLGLGGVLLVVLFLVSAVMAALGRGIYAVGKGVESELSIRSGAKLSNNVESAALQIPTQQPVLIKEDTNEIEPHA
jgi:hypothetical protein